MIEQVKFAAVAPRTFRGDEEYKNVASAAAHVREAASHGARVVCFPEGYPGPCSGPMDGGGKLSLSPCQSMCEIARANNVYISCGDLEPSPEIPDAYYLTQKFISPRGELLANYRRVQPTLPPLNAKLYAGRRHLLPGDELMVVDTEFGKVGLIICSELWVPELARTEMLMGAEIIIAPIGGAFGRARILTHEPGTLSPWQCIASARASENVAYIITTSNVLFPGQPWGTFMIGPEGVLAVSQEESISYATLDMTRLRYIRNTYASDEYMNFQAQGNIPPLGTSPGMNRQRRPELYRKLAEPDPNAYDYFYYKKGLEHWHDEYDKVRREVEKLGL